MIAKKSQKLVNNSQETSKIVNNNQEISKTRLICGSPFARFRRVRPGCLMTGRGELSKRPNCNRILVTMPETSSSTAKLSTILQLLLCILQGALDYKTKQTGGILWAVEYKILFLYFSPFWRVADCFV